MSDHDWEYQEEELNQREIEDMRKHCPGCPYWDDYYLCTMGSCIYDDM